MWRENCCNKQEVQVIVIPENDGAKFSSFTSQHFMYHINFSVLAKLQPQTWQPTLLVTKLYFFRETLSLYLDPWTLPRAVCPAWRWRPSRTPAPPGTKTKVTFMIVNCYHRNCSLPGLVVVHPEIDQLILQAAREKVKVLLWNRHTERRAAWSGPAASRRRWGATRTAPARRPPRPRRRRSSCPGRGLHQRGSGGARCRPERSPCQELAKFCWGDERNMIYLEQFRRIFVFFFSDYYGLTKFYS